MTTTPPEVDPDTIEHPDTTPSEDEEDEEDEEE